MVNLCCKCSVFVCKHVSIEFVVKERLREERRKEKRENERKEKGKERRTFVVRPCGEEMCQTNWL